MPDHATTGDAINHAIDKTTDAVTQIAHSLSSAAPQAWGLLVKATYAQGLIAVIMGGIELLAGMACFVALVWMARTDWSDGASPRNMGAILSGLLTLFFVICGFMDLLNSSSWFEMISPDGYLAQQMLNKAL